MDDHLKPPPPSDPGSNPTIDFRKQKRSNETHQLLTDRFARLFKKSRGSEAIAWLFGTCGHREPEWADGGCSLNAGSGHGGKLGADRGYDTAGFVEQLRALQVTPHVAQNDTNRSSAVDERTARHDGYRVSQRKRKRVEEVFGWMKTVALPRKTRFRGPDGMGWMFTLAAAAYNLVRMRNLQAVNT